MTELGARRSGLQASGWADPARNPLGHRRRIAPGATEHGLSWQTQRHHRLTDQAAGPWALEAPPGRLRSVVMNVSS